MPRRIPHREAHGDRHAAGDRTVGEFVGSPNFLPGEVHDSVVECELGRLPVMARFQGPAEVMIRAESLAIAEDGGTSAEVTAVEYYGHDQMVTVRTFGGRQLRVRLLAAAPFALGQRVAVVVRGDVRLPKSRSDQTPDIEMSAWSAVPVYGHMSIRHIAAEAARRLTADRAAGGAVAMSAASGRSVLGY
jgi:hypothetical protein